MIEIISSNMLLISNILLLIALLRECARSKRRQERMDEFYTELQRTKALSELADWEANDRECKLKKANADLEKAKEAYERAMEELNN